ncbi:MAG: alpha/beta fold hydrolase, partial [Acidobacteriota bacterium]|nr:alpha/beta fold hydrolase [Acidobacteriota bacterium]
RSDAYASEAAFSSGGMLAWQEIAHNAKQRRILVASPLDWSPRVVVDEYDEAWWTLTYLQTGPRWSPDIERFVFLSERDGWTHVYLLNASDPAPEAFPLTAGEFEVEEPVWSPDGRILLLAANRGSLTERGLHLLEVPMTEGELPELEPISQLRGTSMFPRWRPDGHVVAFLHADPENPLDLWVQEPRPDVAEQLTDTWPEGAVEDQLIAPQTVRFSSADGELVPAQIFLPRDYSDRTGPVPVVVWVHGGGIRQNRYGWHPNRVYAMFYGFHQYLLQRGFMIVTVDYRGSIGYGRDFRQGQYLDLGGRDLDDVLATVRYLERVDDVDIGKVAVWGISYGGYLTMQALVKAPTAFDAGVNIAGVVDWLDWAIDPGGLWIDGRMESPENHPELYQQRSPIHFVDQLTRPLLILHGTADQPVPALQTFRLIDALVRADKPFEVMLYPGEEHAFLRSRTWRDVFRRVERFFDATLR